MLTIPENTVAEEALNALQIHKTQNAEKVTIQFKAVGNAPVMKTTKFNVTASNRFRTVIQFLRKQLGYRGSESLYVYINMAFCPVPDDSVSNLFNCFATTTGENKMLIVNYSTIPAWG